MLVSIGVPVYNRAEGLRKTLECLIAQTYHNIEIVISDNGSLSNAVAEVANEFVTKDNRVRFFKQPENKGVSFNFKFVLEKSIGDYFMWATDDDWWSPFFVEKIMTSIRQQPGAIAGCCDFRTVDEEGNILTSGKNFLSYADDLGSKNTIRRLSSFITQYEGYGKANLFYSIVRSDIIKAVPFAEIVKKVNTGADLSIIYYWLSAGSVAMTKEVLRTVTIGNVKYNNQVEIAYPDRSINLLILTIHTAKLRFYWKLWSPNLLYYFRLTREIKLNIGSKFILSLIIAKKTGLFMYDLVCYNVVTNPINIFKYLKRKTSLAQ